MAETPETEDSAGAPFTEAGIERLTQAFYGKVRADDLLAPVFATRIGAGDWPAHIAHISNFWCSVLLRSRAFSGNPMRKHFELQGLTPAHFTRWLSLFRQTADETLTPQQAEMIHATAQRIAQSFQMGLSFHYENSDRKDNAFAEFGLKRS